MSSVRIDVLGSSFTVQTDEDPAYFAELLSYYKSRVDLVESQTKIKDPVRLSVLAALLISDELCKSKASAPAAKPAVQSGAIRPQTVVEYEEAEQIALRLIADIEEKLPEA